MRRVRFSAMPVGAIFGMKMYDSIQFIKLSPTTYTVRSNGATRIRTLKPYQCRGCVYQTNEAPIPVYA